MYLSRVGATGKGRIRSMTKKPRPAGLFRCRTHAARPGRDGGKATAGVRVTAVAGRAGLPLPHGECYHGHGFSPGASRALRGIRRICLRKAGDTMTISVCGALSK